jgi:lipoprotein-anchoring transpeptidase ErfK/SrfK
MKNICTIFSVFIFSGFTMACLIAPVSMAEQGNDYWNGPLRDTHGHMSKRRVVVDVSALPKPKRERAQARLSDHINDLNKSASSPLGQIAVTGPAAVAIAEPAPAVKAKPERSSKAGKKSDKAVQTARYSWEPEKAASGPVTVIISLADQRAVIYRNGVQIGHSVVSTGRRGYETPTGEYTILQKKRRHVSNIYDAPMPYMQRLTWGGIALHGGPVPNRPASHGCIRFPHKFAKLLYSVTNFDSTRVVVTAESHPDGELLTSL